MKVAELIAKLADAPPDAEVVIADVSCRPTRLFAALALRPFKHAGGRDVAEVIEDETGDADAVEIL